MIGWKAVAEVARTGRPWVTTAGSLITVDLIIRHTSPQDWTGGWFTEKDGELVPDPLEENWVADYCMLRKDAARRVAAQLDTEMPRAAIEAAPEQPAIEGEIVSD